MQAITIHEVNMTVNKQFYKKCVTSKHVFSEHFSSPRCEHIILHFASERQVTGGMFIDFCCLCPLSLTQLEPIFHVIYPPWARMY